MKLQISFDMIDLDKALEIAGQIADSVDILEVGTLLIYNHGVLAVSSFKKKFPNKIILADTKIADRAKESVQLFAQAQADWVTVMSGTSKNVIHSACTIAHELNKKVMLDLIDTSSLGQSALEAKNLGADALLLHQAFDEREAVPFLEKWEMLRGNSSLPIFISSKIDRSTIEQVIDLKPDGILLGEVITESGDPISEVAYFANLIRNQ